MAQGDFITTAEVAQLLRISSSTVQKMAREGRLAAFKVGKLWRFPAQSPGILLYKKEQTLARQKESADAKKESAPQRNGLREFLKSAADIGFIEPLDRDKLHGGKR